MAHLAGEQLIALLGLFPSGHVQENAEHCPADDPDILSLPACRDPADLVADQDPEIGFVAAQHRPCRLERRSYPVAVGRVDVRRQFLERDFGTPRHAPKFEAALVHREAIGVDVPGP